MAISEQFKLLNLKKKTRELCTHWWSRRGQNEKKYVLQFKKNFNSSRLFFGTPLALHFKDDL
jgi:hypothetical protein